jgi:hypothetical protein
MTVAIASNWRKELFTHRVYEVNWKEQKNIVGVLSTGRKITDINFECLGIFVLLLFQRTQFAVQIHHTFFSFYYMFRPTACAWCTERVFPKFQVFKLLNCWYITCFRNICLRLIKKPWYYKLIPHQEKKTWNVSGKQSNNLVHINCSNRQSMQLLSGLWIFQQSFHNLINYTINICEKCNATALFQRTFFIILFFFWDYWMTLQRFFLGSMNDEILD